MIVDINARKYVLLLIVIFFFQRPRFNLPRSDRLRIYEAHLGFGLNGCKVSCCQDFTRNALPRIRDMGYNCVLLMAHVENESYSNRGSPFASYFSTPWYIFNQTDLKLFGSH